jgi:glutamyl-tRNA synthetase
MSVPRLRIAPSPTGLFHVGTARTALFNWLEARRTGGTFVLRIEDTDRDRNIVEAIDGIKRSMEWLGLDWDEGPFLQSERRERHVEAALALAEAGQAYWSDPMPLAPDGKPMAYDGRDRDRGLERADGRALRFRTPSSGSTTVVDLIRGEPSFPNDVIEDFGLLKGTGDPLFLRPTSSTTSTWPSPTWCWARTTCPTRPSTGSCGRPLRHRHPCRCSPTCR